jgi:hypothetical protein
MSQEGNLKILESKGVFPSILAAKSHIYIIKGNFSSLQTPVNPFIKLSNILASELVKLTSFNRNIRISLPTGVSIKENFAQHESINVMLEKTGKNMAMHPMASAQKLNIYDDVHHHLPSQENKTYCKHDYKLENGLSDALEQLKINKFCEQKGVFNKYQFWRHHIIGYNPYIESAVDIMKLVFDSDLRKSDAFDKLLDSFYEACENYDEKMKKLATRVAFSTKVIWNPRNLFCGPAGYDHKPKLEENYLNKLPEASYRLINNSYKLLEKISNLVGLMPWINNKSVKLEINNLKKEDKAKIGKALSDIIKFLGFWQELLPENNSQYIFNHIAEFRPFIKGNQIKFDLIGLNICSKNCST